MLGSDVEN